MIAVGYTGWKNLATLQAHLENSPVDCLLVIESEIFAASPKAMIISQFAKNLGPQIYRVQWAKGPWALWGLLCCLHQVLHANQDDCIDFARYAPSDKLEFVTDTIKFLHERQSMETSNSPASMSPPVPASLPNGGLA